MKKLLLAFIVLAFLIGCFEDSDTIYTYTVDYQVYNYQNGSYTVEYLDEAGDGHALNMSADFSYSFTVEDTAPDAVLLVNNTSDTMLIMHVMYTGSNYVIPTEYFKTVEAGESAIIERFFSHE